MSNFIFFWDGPFSNWHPSVFNAKLKNLSVLSFNCAEQFMMAQKAIVFDDHDILYKVMKLDSPREQKALGRKIKNFDSIHWATVREEMVYPGILAKFEQNPNLKQFLLNTRTKIIAEASPYDTIWGIGMGKNDPGIEDPKNWKGLNILGKLVMQARDELSLTAGILSY